MIQAHTGSNKVGAGRKAEMILDRLHEYEEEENPSVRPDARSFNLLISFYAKSKQPDSPYRAEYILNRMISRYRDGQADLVPSIKGITQVIDSYANMGHPDAGRNADRMLKILRDLKRQQGAPKNFISTAVMNSVLFAWSNSGDEEAGFRAENYLDEMEASFQNGVIEMQPDSKSYTLVISAWSKSSNVDKFRRALLVLRRMEHQQQTGNMQILIDEHPRSLVINACAFSNFGGEIELEAFNVACTLFDEILNATNSQPTSLCFGWFIQAMGRLDVEEERKTARIEMAFRECCNAGLVNEFVLHRLKGAAPLGLLQRLIQPANEKSCLQPMDMSRIPQEWTQHCLKQ